MTFSFGAWCEKKRLFNQQIDRFLLMQDRCEVLIGGLSCFVLFCWNARSLVFGKCFWCFGAWKVEMEIARLTRGEGVSRVDAGQYYSWEEV